jgi:cytochrome c oxidase subunit 3
METVVALVVILVAGAFWWLWRQRIFEKPWLTHGPLEDHPSHNIRRVPAAKTGLFLFLVIVTSLFSLFISAYFDRMDLADWRPAPEPVLLWVNTFALILGSVAMQWAWSGARRNDVITMQRGLIAAGVLTTGFVVGQIWAWFQLTGAGFGLQSNPASAFFYALTGVHGLHMIGGMYVWLRTVRRLLAREELERVGGAIELCKTYWHYLLIVWLVLFGLLLST